MAAAAAAAARVAGLRGSLLPKPARLQRPKSLWLPRLPMPQRPPRLPRLLPLLLLPRLPRLLLPRLLLLLQLLPRLLLLLLLLLLLPRPPRCSSRSVCDPWRVMHICLLPPTLHPPKPTYTSLHAWCPTMHIRLVPPPPPTHTHTTHRYPHRYA